MSDEATVKVKVEGAKEGAKDVAALNSELKKTQENAKKASEEVSSRGTKLGSNLSQITSDARELEANSKKAGQALLAAFNPALPEAAEKTRASIALLADESLGFGAKLGALIGIGGAFASVLQSLAGKAIDSTKAWVDNSNKVELLGLNYREFNAATHGLIDAQTVLNDRQTLLSQGFYTTGQQIISLENSARNLGSQTIPQLTQAIQNADNLALVGMGLRIDLTRNKTDQLAQAIEQLAQRSARMQPPEQLGFFSRLAEDTEKSIRLLTNAIDSSVSTTTSHEQALASFNERQRLTIEQTRLVTEQARQQSVEQTKTNDLVRDQINQFNGSITALEAYRNQLQDLYIDEGALNTALSEHRITQTQYNDAIQTNSSAGEALKAVNDALAESMANAATQQSRLNTALREGESQGERNIRVATALSEALKERIAENRLRRRIGTAVSLDARQQGYGSSAEINAALGSLGYSQPGGGGGSGSNPAIAANRQAIHDYEVAAQHALDLHARLPIVAAQAGESTARYYQRMTEAVNLAASAAEHLAQIQQAQYNNDKERIVLAERMRSEQQAENQLWLANLQLAAQASIEARARGIGQAANERATNRGLENQLGLNGLRPGSEDRSADRANLVQQLNSIQEQAGNAQSEQEVEALNARAEAISSVIGRYDALRETYAQSNNASATFAAAFSRHTELTQTSAESFAETASNAYGTLKQAFSTHIKSVIQGKEQLSVALGEILRETLQSIASESAVKAVFETAQGLAALVTPGLQAVAGTHFASAALYGTLTAVGYGASAAIPTIGASASNTASSNSFTGPSPSIESNQGKYGDQRQVTIYMGGNYFGLNQRDAIRDLARDLRDEMRM